MSRHTDEETTFINKVYRSNTITGTLPFIAIESDLRL